MLNVPPRATAEADQALALLSARAVRERAYRMRRLCEDGALQHWRIDAARLDKLADYVVETIWQNYPLLNIPFHARWRHFAQGGHDRWGALESTAGWKGAAEKARAAFDLVIVSVLLDAGAGSGWRYRDAHGSILSRSEGLAVASLEMFAAGAFSGDPSDPRRADAKRLRSLTPYDLARGFQVSATNPLVGLESRATLLNALGKACLAAPQVFAREDRARPGGLFDHLLSEAADAAGHALRAEAILNAVLAKLGTIWPSRLTLGGVALGDTWRHPAIRTGDATDGLVPFHKLSQWLTYSLIEPLQAAGISVTDIDALTGLPEYRNGGLFIDLGALVPTDASALNETYAVDSLFIVEWRALTVALLDEIADRVRARLELDAARLPLACVLEGGTWAAGRRIARVKRADGSPPLKIESDGTVF
ncbi:MAG: URC4/urg3 family protein [Beijerinckiaceae bacterium]